MSESIEKGGLSGPAVCLLALVVALVSGGGVAVALTRKPSSSAPKWEYRAIEISVRPTWSLHLGSFNAGEMAEQLSDEGRAGWELVSALPIPPKTKADDETKYRLLFKRPGSRSNLPDKHEALRRDELRRAAYEEDSKAFDAHVQSIGKGGR